MSGVVYALFALLAVVSTGIQYFAMRTKSQLTSGNNPQFLKFQRQFFAVYFLALFSDWLQGPYVYKLYSYYGFAESQIAVLYVVGFGSGVLFGTATGPLADKFGRKKMCIAFSVTYSVCCLTKLSSSFNVLILGRIFGGISTSMLFSTFEAWYVYEHINTYDFPPEWISVTFSKATFWNGILAIVAGVSSNVVAEWMRFGPVAPFILAVPCLAACGVLVWLQWGENYGNQKLNFGKSCMQGLQKIVWNDKIFLLGLIQSIFESTMYIFVFLWTPILDSLHPPLGIIFSCFMVSIMIGSSLYTILLAKHYRAEQVLSVAMFVLLACMCICVVSTDPRSPGPYLSLAAFLMLEISVGMYFPAIGFLRSQVIPESLRANIMNWFRVPMNTLTCGGLLWLHNEHSDGGNQTMFTVCALITCLGMYLSLKFNSVHQPEAKQVAEEGDV